MNIARLKYGNTNTYFADGLLIDTDMPGTLPGLFRELKSNGITLKDIRVILATHYHPDHIGLVSELMDYGIRLLIVDKQLSEIHYADSIFARQKNLIYRPIDENKAAVIRCDESRAFLSEMGIAGEIVPTESHSSGGVALMLDGGPCFVGDLEPRQFSGAYGSGCPLEQDWKLILSYHPSVIHYGHANDQYIPENKKG